MPPSTAQNPPTPPSPPFDLRQKPVAVTVVVYRGQRSDEAEQQAHDLAATLSQLSGRQWTIGRVVHQDSRPTRGSEFALGDALTQNQAWGDQNVWVYGDSMLGAPTEHYLADGKAGLWDGGGGIGTSNIQPSAFSRPLSALVFNTTRPEEQLHTVIHGLESVARRYDVDGLRQYSGRPEDDPLHYESVPSTQAVPAYGGGHGVAHLPPGSAFQYTGYNQPNSPWGGTEQGFYNWWMAEAPRRWWDDLAGDGQDVQSTPQAPSTGTFKVADLLGPATDTPPDGALAAA